MIKKNDIPLDIHVKIPNNFDGYNWLTSVRLNGNYYY